MQSPTNMYTTTARHEVDRVEGVQSSKLRCGSTPSTFKFNKLFLLWALYAIQTAKAYRNLASPLYNGSLMNFDLV